MQTFAPKGNVYGPILPQFILERPISLGAKVTYSLLCNYAYEKDHCWPSLATLVKRLSCSLNSVKKYIQELVDAKLIKIVKEHGRSSVYYMLFPQEWKKVNAYEQQPNIDCDMSNADNESSKFDSEPSNFGCINNLNKQNKEEIPPLPPTKESQRTPSPPSPRQSGVVGGAFSFSDEFEKAWELYPKKQGKALARIAWGNLYQSKALPPVQSILDAIAYFSISDSWQRENGRFIPQFSNWLRGQRWLDARSAQEEQAWQEHQTRQKASQERKAQEEQIRKQEVAHKEALRPFFEAFAAKFSKPPVNGAMAFGTWIYLHSKGFAPLSSDVLQDNSQNIIDFMKEHRRKHEELAYKAERKQAALCHMAQHKNVPHIAVPHERSTTGRIWQKAV